MQGDLFKKEEPKPEPKLTEKEVIKLCRCTCHSLMENFGWPESGIKSHYCCPKLELVNTITRQHWETLTEYEKMAVKEFVNL